MLRVAWNELDMIDMMRKAVVIAELLLRCHAMSRRCLEIAGNGEKPLQVFCALTEMIWTGADDCTSCESGRWSGGRKWERQGCGGTNSV